jgi:uncharacterized protein (DUF433 family)
MRLEDYFDFQSLDDIRLKNSRIGIETILYEYIYRVQTPEEIAKAYPSLSLEQVYATILYYLHEQEKITQYMEKWLVHCQQGEQQQDENPPEFIRKLRRMRGKQQTQTNSVDEHSVLT